MALICFDNPFLKPAEGGKKSMLTRIKSLAEMDDVEADIYLLNKSNEGWAVKYAGLEEKMHFNQFQMNQPSVGMLFSRFPVCSNKRYVKKCVEELCRHSYDIAIYEGEQVAKYRLHNVVKARKHILYMHDIESEYRLAISKTTDNLIKKWANRLESFKFRGIEKRIYRFFDSFWFISNDECQKVKGIINNKSCEYLPAPAGEIANKPVSGNKKPVLLYVGDLTLPHNVISVRWFIENVFTKVLEHVQDCTLRVIGNINEEGKKELTASNVEVLGYVDDINAEYQNASCIVSPVLYGAGVKIKVIDAMGKGQIVITNPKGIEGTELVSGKHLLVANEPQKMADYCIGILRNRDAYEKIAEQGLTFIRNNHSISCQAQLMRKTFKELIGE